MKSLKSYILLFAAFALVLVTTACPAKNESVIRKAAKASYQLSGLTRDAIRTTQTAFEAGQITLAQKDRIALALVKLAKGGAAFNALVVEANRTHGTAGEIPLTKLDQIQRVFDSDLVSPFLALLTEIGGSAVSAQVKRAIELIRTAILAISAALTSAGFAVVRLKELEASNV